MFYSDLKPGDIFLINPTQWIKSYHSDVYLYVGIVTDPDILNEYEANNHDYILREWYNVTKNMTQYWFGDDDSRIVGENSAFKEKI